MRLGYSLFFCFLLLLVQLPLSANYTQSRDSLLNLYSSMDEPDSAAFDVLIKLSKNYSIVNWDSSIIYANKALKTANKMGNKLFVAQASSRLGSAYNMHGEYVKAIDYYQLMGAIYDDLGHKGGTAFYYNVMGVLHRKIKEYAKALEYYNKSMELQLELNNKEMVIGLYNNLGNLYWDMGEFDKAMSSHMKCLDYKKKVNDKSGIANSSNGIGGLFEEMGEYDKAMEYYIASKRLYAELEDIRGLCYSYSNLGRLSFLKKQYQKSIVNCDQALDYAKRLADAELLMKSCNCLSMAHEKMGNTGMALGFYKRYVAIRDSSNNDAVNREIAKKEMQFKYQKKAAADSAYNAQLQKVKDAELRIQETQLNTEQQYRYVLLLMVLLLLSSAIFVYKRLQVARRQNRIIKEQKGIVEKQKYIVDEQNKDILDSIRYAENIQNAMLPVEEHVKKLLPNSFVVFKPKDIVSGDFYWISEQNGSIYFAVCDCTGHGVPGAFMSMIGSSLLNEAVNEKGIVKPNNIFQEVRKGFKDALKQTGQQNEQKDGMDAVLCHWNRKKKLEFAAAYNPFIMVRNQQIQEIKADKQPVGVFLKEEKPYTHHELEVERGDMVYLFSDGYSDQFGGPRGKKFKYSLFKKLLLNIHDMPMERQKLILEDTLEQWQGDENQVDDILVMGVRF